jgi:hypothetical protein
MIWMLEEKSFIDPSFGFFSFAPPLQGREPQVGARVARPKGDHPAEQHTRSILRPLPQDLRGQEMRPRIVGIDAPGLLHQLQRFLVLSPLQGELGQPKPELWRLRIFHQCPPVASSRGLAIPSTHGELGEEKLLIGRGRR